MPLLAAFLGSCFTALIQFLVKFVTQKTAVGLAAAALLTTVTVVVFVALRNVLASLSYALPDMAAGAFAMTVPSVAPACLTAIATVWTATTLYTWQRRAIDVFVKS